MNLVCLQLLGAKPQTPTGALPLDPTGGFRAPDPLFCTPLADFWIRPCKERTVIIEFKIHPVIRLVPKIEW